MIMTSAFLEAFDHANCKVKTVIRYTVIVTTAASPGPCAVKSLVQMAAAVASRHPKPFTFRAIFCRNMHTFFVEFKYVT
jgi:hypothetical protein